MRRLIRQLGRILPRRLRRTAVHKFTIWTRPLHASHLADIATPMAVRVAVGWRLPTLISEGTRSAEDLARSAGIPAGRMTRLLRFLLARDLLNTDSEGHYRLTRLGKRVLKPGMPAYLINPNEALGRAELSFMHLEDALRSGRPMYGRMYGSPFWEHLDEVPELGASMDACMEDNSQAIAKAIKARYEWASVDHLVDVGGGRGVVARELLRAHPTLTGTIVDLPRAAGEAEIAIKRDGLEERCDVLASSFFDEIPIPGATYLLSNILHDWDDAECINILRRCAEAAGHEGRVLIVEEVPELGADMRRFTHSDLQMLLFFGSRERTLDEYKRLLTEAGLELVNGISTDASYGILVGKQAGERP